MLARLSALLWLIAASRAAYNATLGLGNGLILNQCHGDPVSTSTSSATGLAATIVDAVKGATTEDDSSGWSTADDPRLNKLGNKVQVSTSLTPGCSFSYVCDGCTSFYLLCVCHSGAC